MYSRQMRRAHNLFVLLLISVSLNAVSARAEEGIQAISYNAGLAKAFGIEFVADVEPRLARQIQVLDSVLRPPFVLMLQEIWTRKAQEAYRDWASKRGFSVAAIDPKKNGLMILTSGPVEKVAFQPFSKTTYGRGFGVLEAHTQFNGKIVRILDAHTIFSPFTEVSEVHRSQLATIAKLSHTQTELPTILGADLNVGPDLFYHNGTYDPALEIWYGSFLAILHPSWSWAGGALDGPTWDESNPLVARPPRWLKHLGMLDSNGGWGYSSSQLDHVFVSNHFKIQEARLALNKPLNGLYLSDHYACQALLGLYKR